MTARAFARYERALAEARAAAFDLGLELHAFAVVGEVSPVTSRRVFAALTASQGGIDSAMTHASEAHRRSTQITDLLGVDPVAFGGQTYEPDEEERRRRG